MHHGTVLGDTNKKAIPRNSPVMHCQHCYSQVSSIILQVYIKFIIIVRYFLFVNTIVVCQI